LTKPSHYFRSSLCKAALAITVVRVVLYPVRRLCLVRQFVASIRYGLSYAVCFVSIYGLSFNEGARLYGNTARDEIFSNMNLTTRPPKNVGKEQSPACRGGFCVDREGDGGGAGAITFIL